ncbi:TonB-dependent receptor [Adhaeribacter aerolatus]|uniref:TonB-dependent receptor n=1 Tax=Adhaeribacter aerolatus TaxID=670289 RepID=A0A512AS42_9BACT|nr:TonB-dependent receptor [Adhaeribacter aerolatus]GEO02529.1 TonB-dependent receptor [Adhaeribacter aerolatus]
MARWVYFYFLLCWLGLPAARAQTDSLSGKDLREVQVFGRPITRYAAGSRVTTLDSTFLQLQNSSTLAEALQFRTPIYLKSYGQSMLATAAFRGTSASQTAVLWHGFNINSPTLGQTDFSNIPVNGFNQATVQHGSAGAVYGTGAIGGAVLLTAAENQPNGLQLLAQQDFGSFGYNYSSLGGSYGNAKLKLQTTVYQQQSRNDFPFRNSTKFGHPTEKQENAALLGRGITQDATLKINPRNTLAFHGWYTFSDNESQPNMVAANTQARLQNENLRLMTAWQHQSKLGNTAVKAAFFNDFMHYQDVNNNSLTEVKTYQTQAEHDVMLKEKLSMKVGAEAQYFAADVSGYGRAVSEKRAAAFGWLRYNIFSRLQLSTNIRQSFIKGFNPPLAPTVGINYYVIDKPAGSLILKGNISRGYRVPTLNDRFWPTGNTHLIPEASWSYEGGLKHQLKAGQFQLSTEATLYHLDVDNWIQWVPNLTGQWQPQNLKKVTSRGLELSTEASYGRNSLKLTAGGTYAYTHTEQRRSYQASGEPLNRQLIYVPKHTATGFGNIYYKSWLGSANLNFTGYRYTTAENDRWLPSFALLNLMVGKTFVLQRYQIQIIGKVNNATNQVYQTMEYYAMPQRHYGLSLRFKFN